MWYSLSTVLWPRRTRNALITILFTATLDWRDKLADIAIKYKGRIVFAVASDDHQEEKMQDYGFDESHTDMNVGCTTKEGEEYFEF